MAKGRAKSGLWLLLTALVFALLVISGILPNPLPGIWDWLEEDRPIAPDLAWQERLGSRPDGAAVAGDAIAVDAGTSTQVRDRLSGAAVPPPQAEGWAADWVLAAGSGDDAVVIIGPEDADGYRTHDPATGRTIHEEESAVAVWGFRDARLDLHCDGERACQLRAYPPRATAPAWTTDLPGRRAGGTLGAEPALAGPGRADPRRIHPGASGPAPLPPLLGFPLTRGGDDLVAVVRTSDGAIVQLVEPGADERVLVAGGRVIRSVMERHGGVCVSTVTGHDAATGTRVWGPRPFHLWATEDVGCEQRRPPLGSGAALAVVGADGRPRVVDAYDGRMLWTGERDEQVEGLSPDLAVVRAADETTRFGVRLGGDGARLWERTAAPDAGVTLARCGVVVSDRSPNRMSVWDPATGGIRLSTPTSARVLACAPDGVLLADGRSVGFARFPDAPAGDSEERLPDPK